MSESYPNRSTFQPPQHDTFLGEPAFRSRLYRALRRAAADFTIGSDDSDIATACGAPREPSRRLCWCDVDYSAWPLGEADWITLLTRWAQAGGPRELVMIAADYAPIRRLHPRFVTWRREWAHFVRCLQPEPERMPDELPTLWLDGAAIALGGRAENALRVLDRRHWRGRCSLDHADCHRVSEEFDAIAQRASPAFTAVTLGL